MPKRKSASVEPDRPETKRSKHASPPASGGPVQKKNADGNPYWELSTKRRVTIEEYKGMTLVSIREFYEKDGKMLPGKSGISLKVEQLAALVQALPQIRNVLEEKEFKLPEIIVEELDENGEAEGEEASNGEGE